MSKANPTTKELRQSDVEVLFVEEDPFDEILRDYMTAQFNMKMTAIDAFPYFKYLDQTQKTHLAKISVLKEFAPLETILHEDRGILGYVHFVISGTCMILQCLKMRVKRNYATGQKFFELMKLSEIDPEEEQYMSEEERLKKFREQEREVSAQANLAKMNEEVDVDIGRLSDDEEGSSEEEFENLMKKLKLVDEGKYASPCGVVLKPAREVRPTDRSTRFSMHSTTGKSRSHASMRLTFENQFVNAGLFSFGGMFGLGEKLEHRAIMSQTIVQCLLVPRFWLFEKPQNPGNMWNRIRFTLNSTIPSREGLFQNFLDTQKWEKYKKWLIESVLNERRIYNPTKLQDIPLICRIVEGIDKNDKESGNQ